MEGAATNSKPIPFAFFVSLVEAVAAIKPRKAGDKSSSGVFHAVQTFRNWTTEVHRRYAPLPSGTTAAVFRLLFPEEDVDRKYGMQETQIAKYLAKICGVSTAAEGRGNSLVNWNGENALGCLGSELQQVMEDSANVTTSSCTIIEVDTLLTELASKCAFSAHIVRDKSVNRRGDTTRSRGAILHSLYSGLSPGEACVVTQIILKDLRPLLHPLPEGQTHYTTLLLQYNSNCLAKLTLSDAMQIWDPSGHMSKAYRVRARIDEAAHAYERTTIAQESSTALRPQVGIPVQIPKCVKGQGCGHSLQMLRGSKKVWAETKYDGERAQIHLELVSCKPHITIYSKSGRDSTLDRTGVHSVICDALQIDLPTCKIKTNVIVEAEMVAFSDILNRVDEFWRIRSLMASSAIGPRHARASTADPEYETAEEDQSQCSLVSNASDGGTRHLALVFFDILMLNNESLLSSPYSSRRAMLEDIVRTIPGYSMLAARTQISLLPSPSLWTDTGEDQLQAVFARLIAHHQEGLVIKADEAKYNERRLPWVKLKKDYIPGYGDALDLVLVGAAWEKDRARELRVAPTAYTTFYLGALSNKEAMTSNPRCLPHFEVFFTVSYGLSREALEEVNFMVKSSGLMDYSARKPTHGLSYTYSLFQGIQPPAVLLRQPLLAEVFGAGFTKALHGQFYELRFPRLTKVHRSGERSWTDSVTLRVFQDIAREVIGRDRQNKDVEDWCNELWGKPTSAGATCSLKRKHTEEVWVEKLRLVDQKKNDKAKAKSSGRVHFDSSRVHHQHREEENMGSAHVHCAQSPKPLRALGSMTNIARQASASPNPSPLRHTPEIDRSTASDVPTSVQSRASRLSMASQSSGPAHAIEPDCFVASVTSSTKDGSSGIDQGERRISIPGRKAHTTNVAMDSLNGICEISADVTAGYRSTPLGVFLRSAIVWIPRAQNSPRPTWRAPLQSTVPAAQQVHGLETFLQACGWCPADMYHTSCDWVERGVVFVDDTDSESDVQKQWLEHPLKTLMNRRSSLVSLPGYANCKPVWVFSMRMLSHEELQKGTVDVESRAICRLG